MRGGGSAGHNGLKSITAHIGNEYCRVRMGIDHPGDRERVHDYVLGDFAKSEHGWVETMCRACAENTELLLSDKDASFANKVHLAMG